MKTCAVATCKNMQGGIPKGITYFSFPKNEIFRMAWQLRCGRDSSYDFSRARVCHTHFEADDFERDLRNELLGQPLKKRLKPGAVPRVNVVEIKSEPIFVDDFEIEEESTFSVDSQSTPSSNLDNTHFVSTVDTSSGYVSELIPVKTEESDPAPLILPSSEVSSSNSSYVPSSLPASQNWAGPYNFCVSFNSQKKDTKGVSWTYSKIKNKLYVGKDLPCPINFCANISLGDNVSIRAMALYGSPEHASEIVHRCVNHANEERNKDIFEADHLVRCESIMARYKEDSTTKRHSVVVPFEVPQAGQQYSTYIYKFTCFGSCAGGPSRRPIMLIFSLEKDGQVVGRRRIDVKICACPGRDRKAEEQQLEQEKNALPTKRKESDGAVSLADSLAFTRSIVLPPVKKTKHSHKTYSISVNNKEQFEFLTQMNNFYEMCKVMNNLPPDFKRTLALHNYHQNEDSG